MVILLAEETEESAYRHIILKMHLHRRQRLHRMVKYEFASFSLTIAHGFTAGRILNDARLRLDVAFFEFELGIIIVIEAQARRHGNGRLMADIAIMPTNNDFFISLSLYPL